MTRRSRAFESRASGIQLQGQGTVTQLLPDDNSGSRHQRFILKLRSGQTLLIAHNIDTAPRIDSLQVGGSVAWRIHEGTSKGVSSIGHITTRVDVMPLAGSGMVV